MIQYKRKFNEGSKKIIKEYSIQLIQDTDFNVSRLGLFKDGKEMLYTSTGVFADIEDLFNSLYKSTFKTIQKN